ncbi:DUF998 domain-containing protein [bacterium]|nr:DUF998 domain-containing protein [bacterium]
MNKTIGIKTIFLSFFCCIMFSYEPINASEKQIKSKNIVQQEIETQISHLQKTVKKIEALKITLPIILFGGSTALVTVGAVATLGALGLAILAPEVMIPLEATGLAVLGIKGVATITTIVAGLFTAGAALTGIASTIGTFGGLSTSVIIVSLHALATLEAIEQKNPGILTEKQKNIIASFKKHQQGPIFKGIIKGSQLNNALDNAVKKVEILYPGMSTNKTLIKKVKNYIKAIHQEKNLSLALAAYQRKKESYETIKNESKKWGKKYNQANLKLIALNLNPKILILKIEHKKLKKKVATIEKENKTIQKDLAEIIKEYRKNVETILSPAKKPIKKEIV